MKRKSGSRKEVLRELERLAQGFGGGSGSLGREFLECQPWQQCSQLLARALWEEERDRQRRPLVAPGGWFPPNA